MFSPGNPLDLIRAARGRKFGTILADPPWQFQNRTGKVAPEHKRLNRYGTMALEEICALPGADIAASRRTAISTASDQSPPAKPFLPIRACHHARMTGPRKQARIQTVCGACGSADVSRDAWADWNAQTQQWELRCVFDHAHCHDCDGETHLVEVSLGI